MGIKCMIDEIVENFSLLDDWEDRYRYVIELGDMLAPYPQDKRDEAHKVQGCVSQVWLASSHNEGILTFLADSDAHIVRGLLFILLELYHGLKPADILAVEVDKFLTALGLDAHLTPQRANGVRAVIERIRAIALTHDPSSKG